MILLATLVLGIGLCAFDGDGHGHGTSHHGMSPDLCLGFLVPGVAVTLLGLTEVDRLPSERLSPVLAVSLHRLDPPPKFASIS